MASSNSKVRSGTGAVRHSLGRDKASSERRRSRSTRQRLTRRERLPQDEPSGGDVILHAPRIMSAGSRLEHSDRASQLRLTSNELQQNHVVRQMRHAILRQPTDPEELGHLLGQNDADSLAGAALKKGVDVLAESNVV